MGSALTRLQPRRGGQAALLEKIRLSKQGEPVQGDFESLTALAEKGDRDVISSLLPLLTHTNEYVRFGAAESLRTLARKGDPDVISFLLPLLRGFTRNLAIGDVRRCAAETLRALAEKGDPDVISSLLPLLTDTDKDVRRGAAAILGALAEKGDRDVISSLLPLLTHNDGDVRFCAAETLGAVAEKGDRDVISSLLPFLTDTDKDVRRCAAGALGALAEKGDRDVISSLLPLLTDTDRDVRRCAPGILGALAEQGDRRVIRSLLPLLTDTYWDVRDGAAETLGAVAEKGDRDVISSLLSLLTGTDWHVRVCAAETLVALEDVGRIRSYGRILSMMIGCLVVANFMVVLAVQFALIAALRESGSSWCFRSVPYRLACPTVSQILVGLPNVGAELEVTLEVCALIVSICSAIMSFAQTQNHVLDAISRLFDVIVLGYTAILSYATRVCHRCGSRAQCEFLDEEDSSVDLREDSEEDSSVDVHEDSEGDDPADIQEDFVCHLKLHECVVPLSATAACSFIILLSLHPSVNANVNRILWTASFVSAVIFAVSSVRSASSADNCHWRWLLFKEAYNDPAWKERDDHEGRKCAAAEELLLAFWSVNVTHAVLTMMSICVYGITKLPTSSQNYCEEGSADDQLQATWHGYPVEGLFVVSLLAACFSLCYVPEVIGNLYGLREMRINRFQGYPAVLCEVFGLAWFTFFYVVSRATECGHIPCGHCKAKDWQRFGVAASRSMFAEVMALQGLLMGLVCRTSTDLVLYFRIDRMAPFILLLLPIALLVVGCFANPGALLPAVEDLDYTCTNLDYLDYLD